MDIESITELEAMEVPAEARKRVRRVFSRIGIALLVVIAATTVVQFILDLIAESLAASGNDISNAQWYIWVLIFVPLYVVGIPIGLLILKKLPVGECEPQKFGAKNFILFLIMCFPMMLFGSLIGNALSSLISGGTAQNALLDFVFDSSPLRIVVMIILAPIVEEFLFRKQIIDRCAKYGEKIAIMLSAITFGLFHMNLYQFFYAFGLGLLFGYVYVRTRRLRYTVIMHIFINFLGGFVAPSLLSSINLETLNMGISEEAMMEMLPSLLGFGLYMLVYIGLSIAGLVLLIIRVQKLEFHPAPEEIPKKEAFKTVYINVGMILFIVICLGLSFWVLLR